MLSAGLRVLKAQLSRHVRHAQAGARIVITDRGKPIAVLGPVESHDVPGWAQQLVVSRKAAWNGGKPSGLQRRVPFRDRPASREILEDRR